MSSQNKIINMRTIVGVALVIFVILFGTIVLFGVINTVGDSFSADNNITNSTHPLNLFKELYFALIAGVLGILYLSNFESFTTKTEHALIILSILVVSVSVATLAGSLKNVYDTNYNPDASQNYVQLQANNVYYLQYAQWLVDTTSIIHSRNVLLEAQIQNLTEHMNNQAINYQAITSANSAGTVGTSPTEILNTGNNVPVDDSINYEYG